LHVDELANAMDRELPAEPGVLDAAEGQARIALDHAVDEDGAGLDARDEALGLRRIPGPGGGSEAEAAVVREGDGLVEAADAEEARHGAEDLLLRRGALRRHVAEHGRRVEVAGSVEAPPAHQEARARVEAPAHEVLDL